MGIFIITPTSGSQGTTTVKIKATVPHSPEFGTPGNRVSITKNISFTAKGNSKPAVVKATLAARGDVIKIYNPSYSVTETDIMDGREPIGFSFYANLGSFKVSNVSNLASIELIIVEIMKVEAPSTVVSSSPDIKAGTVWNVPNDPGANGWYKGKVWVRVKMLPDSPAAKTITLNIGTSGAEGVAKITVNLPAYSTAAQYSDVSSTYKDTKAMYKK